MSESNSNLANDASQLASFGANSRQTVTTVWGSMFIALAVIGLLFTMVSIFLTNTMAADKGYSDLELFISVVASTLSKVALLMFGIGLVLRARWINKMLWVGLLVSTFDTVIAIVTMLSSENNASVELMERAIIYTTMAFSYFISLAI